MLYTKHTNVTGTAEVVLLTIPTDRDWETHIERSN